VYLLRLLVAALFIISVSHRLPLRVANSNKVPDMDVRRQYVFHEIWAEAITGELRRLGNRACTMRAVSEDVVANHTPTNESLASNSSSARYSAATQIQPHSATLG